MIEAKNDSDGMILSQPFSLPKRDGHTHTEFCPHGSREATELFIHRAIELGFEIYSLTEHPPLPVYFRDPAPDRSCGMVPQDLELYLSQAKELSDRFSNRIVVKVGLEVDFIPGFEGEIRHLLNQVGSELKDSVLSVHFLQGKDGWRCVDYSAEDFKEGLLGIYGSIEAVHEAYWLTVKQAVEADLGPFKPRRIGHLSLVHKFQKKFPLQDPKRFLPEVRQILDGMQARGMELDLNAAGLFKPHCQELYPSPWILREAIRRNIPLVFGSDAHSVKGVGQGFEAAERLVQSLMSAPAQ
jgi:histidinol-phosphatase (PHP family)